jgi:hypothetical protein
MTAAIVIIIIMVLILLGIGAYLLFNKPATSTVGAAGAKAGQIVTAPAGGSTSTTSSGGVTTSVVTSPNNLGVLTPPNPTAKPPAGGIAANNTYFTNLAATGNTPYNATSGAAVTDPTSLKLYAEYVNAIVSSNTGNGAQGFSATDLANHFASLGPNGNNQQNVGAGGISPLPASVVYNIPAN